VRTRRPNAGAGAGCYLFSFEVRAWQGRVTLPCKSLREVHALNRSGALGMGPLAPASGLSADAAPCATPQPSLASA